MPTDRRRVFAELHREGLFLMPNPWDVGSARVLESLGYAALATTSSGHAATLGRADQHVTREELVEHASTLAGRVDVPVSVDAEHGFGAGPDDVAGTVALLAATPAAGCSIEDYQPARGAVLPLPEAVGRVGAAAEVARRAGLVLTARAENHLHDAGPLEDTIERLRAYRAAGADVLYAPGLTDLADISQLVRAVAAPVNVLLLPGGPSVAELASVGVRRVSTGGSLAWAAYGALRTAATELLERGTTGWAAGSLSPEERRRVLRG